MLREHGEHQHAYMDGSLADDPKMSLRMIVKSWHHNEIVRRFIDYMHDSCMLYLCPEAAMYLYIRSNINKYRQKKWNKTTPHLVSFMNI